MSKIFNDRYEDSCEVSLSAHDQYMREVSWVERMRPEEEEWLLQCVLDGKVEQSKECPDQAMLDLASSATSRLVEAYQLLVIFLAKRWVFRCSARRMSGMDFLDLVQEANIGLLQAIRDCDHSRGYDRFSGFVSRCINNAVVRAIYDRGYVVRLPKDVHEVVQKARRAEWVLLCELGREPTRVEIAVELKMSEAKLVEWLDLSERGPVASLHALLDEDEDLIDCLGLTGLYESSSCDEQRSVVVGEVVRQALDQSLSLRQRQVMELRYGLASETSRVHSQSEVAALVGSPYQSVQRWERQAKGVLCVVLAPVCGVLEGEWIA